MHPRVRKELTPLTKLELNDVDSHEGKFEHFRKQCAQCGGQTVHRFSTGDELAIGTCRHEWGLTSAQVCAQPTLPLFDR